MGIDPGTSWLACNHIDHKPWVTPLTNQLKCVHIHVYTCTFYIPATCSMFIVYMNDIVCVCIMSCIHENGGAGRAYSAYSTYFVVCHPSQISNSISYTTWCIPYMKKSTTFCILCDVSQCLSAFHLDIHVVFSQYLINPTSQRGIQGNMYTHLVPSLCAKQYLQWHHMTCVVGNIQCLLKASL